MRLNSSSEARSSAVDCFTLSATPFPGAGAVFSHSPSSVLCAVRCFVTSYCEDVKGPWAMLNYGGGQDVSEMMACVTEYSTAHNHQHAVRRGLGAQPGWGLRRGRGAPLQYKIKIF